MAPSMEGKLLSERLIIGRWKSLLRSSIYGIPLEQVREVKRSFVGSLRRGGCSMLDRSITSLSPMMVLLSLESVSGRIRSPQKWRSLLSWLS